MSPGFKPHTHQQTEWSRLVPDAEWQLYGEVIQTARARGIPFALGGAFALATYTGYWRDTKDLDVYVLPQDRERMIEVVTGVGLSDFFDQKPYDRWWIYRAANGCAIVDVIWAMANRRAQIDDLWLSGPEVNIRGELVRVLPAEAALWDKLYIMQRDRCDWPDVMNLIYSAGADIDWEYLLRRIGDDAPLLAGALSVFRWMAPGRAQCLPGWLWGRLGLPAMPDGQLTEIDARRVSLLDSRPWFGPDREKLQNRAESQKQC